MSVSEMASALFCRFRWLVRRAEGAVDPVEIDECHLGLSEIAFDNFATGMLVLPGSNRCCAELTRDREITAWAGIEMKQSLDAIPVQKQLARPRVLSWLRREVLGSGVEVA
jgi:hypothetical protein